LVDSAEACARYVRDRLQKQRLLSARKRTGIIQPFVTDETDRFDAVAKRFLKAPTEAPWKIDLAF
jgi:glutamate racemase